MEDHPFDQWLVDGDPVFGTVPGGLLRACPHPAPIYLFRGTAAWGWTHITHRHRTNTLFQYARTVEGMVLDRCGQQGDIHPSRDPAGLTISITVAPRAFIVLRYQPAFDAYSITTMFNRRPRQTPEPVIGRFEPRQRLAARCVFAWLPYR